MPSSLKLAEEHGDDLGLVFVEVQGTPKADAEAFAWRRGWMNTNAMWGTEAPVRSDAKGIPWFALLSAEGEILLSGNPLQQHSAIEDAIEAEIGAARKVPKSAPKSLQKAMKSYLKGDAAKAMAQAWDVEIEGDEDAALAAELRANWTSQLEARYDRVDWMIDNGYLNRAQNDLKKLSSAAKGIEAFDTRAEATKKRLDSDELDAERAAAKAFANLERKLREDGFDKKLVVQLERFVKKKTDTKTWQRAEGLLKLAKRD